MNAGTLGRLILVGLSILTISAYLRAWRRTTHPVSRAARGLIIAATGLLILSAAAAVPRPTTLLLRAVVIVAFHQSALLTYVAVVQLTQSTPYRWYATPFYRRITLLSGLNVVLEYLRRDNLGSFIDDEPYRPTLSYVASYALFYAVWVVIGLAILVAMWRFMQQNRLLPYRVRTSVALLAWGVITLAGVVVEINLGLSVLLDDTYRAPLNAVYHALKAPVGVLILLSAAPTPVVAVLARPLNAWLTRRQAQRTRLIGELHTTMIRLVPQVHLPNAALREIRAPIEISDAREVIWSHHPQTTPITPRAEADLLGWLLRDQVTLTSIGPYAPPATAEPLAIHNLKVAKLLQQNESKV